jgi:hypothetical protein
MMLRLSFRGAPCPSVWGSVSKPICNLINSILLSNNWDHTTHFAYKAPKHVPPKEILFDNIPFGIGKDFIVDTPMDMRGIVIIYIDNFIGLIVDVEDSDNTTQFKQAPLLGLTAVSREISPLKPLPSNDMDAWAKLKAKTGLTEVKVIHGWLLNF